METRRVLIVGDTLFAETLAKLLAQDATTLVVGTASSLEEALPAIKTSCVDAVLVAGVERLPESVFSQIFAANPDISILCTDLDTNDVQVMVKQRISVHTTGDLLAVIATLPKR